MLLKSDIVRLIKVLDLIAKTLAYSSGIAIGAASITLIYSTTRTFNFAHATMVTWGFYIVFTMQSFLGGSPYYYILFAGLFSAFLGVILYLGVNRPLIKAGVGEITLMMSTLGVDLIYFGFLGAYIDYLLTQYKIYATQFYLELYDFIIPVGGAGYRGIGLVAPLVMITVIILLHLFLTRTRIGIAMRASIENPSLAGLLGINTDVIYLLAWVIGGFLAGLSGGLLSLTMAGYDKVGMDYIVTFFTGSIVGGLYSIFGSLLGGLLTGMGEYIGTYLLSLYVGTWITTYRPAIPLAIMVATLLLKPEGLAAINWSRIYSSIKSLLR